MVNPTVIYGLILFAVWGGLLAVLADSSFVKGALIGAAGWSGLVIIGYVARWFWPA